jgi:ATP-dependent helicase/nuclease subunit B
MSLNWDQKPCIYTIPADNAFADTLARGIMAMAGNEPLALAQYQILLPTRRGARALRDAFLKISDGKPLLLPRLHPIGDVDEDELSLLLNGAEEELDLPPALSPMRRQFLLTRMIAAKQDYSRGLDQDMLLANALGRLMDEVYTEDLNLANLPDLVSKDFAAHWEVSTKFLEILSKVWPSILEAEGVIDSADRRNRLIKRLAQHWATHPPEHPVIAAGSTGSIPATLALLKSIANMPKGCIVLPGLDQYIDEESWEVMDDTHPQSTLRYLLQQIGIERSKIPQWPWAQQKPQHKIPALVSEIMRPAETAAAWQTLRTKPVISSEELEIERYDCANPQEEAFVIALALRRALENTPRIESAALVTPDRNLARRVAMACRRWGIEIDDSAGVPLSQSPIGIYLSVLLDATLNELKPISLLSFTKHTYCQPPNIEEWRSKIRDLDRHTMRGHFTGKMIEGYFAKIAEIRENGRFVPPHAEATLEFIAERFKPLLDCLSTQHVQRPMTEWLDAHLKTAENFSDPNLLWSGVAGEKAALLFAELREQADIMPVMTLDQYASIIAQLMTAQAVRPAYGLHPRLMILGQLEARLGQADIMILSGLNEGVWPPDPGADPWMSRPMRRKFGLPSLEKSIGLAAHDFAQAFCAPKIILTRAVRVDGTPTVPARWLQRFDTVLQACGIDPSVIRQGKLISYARALNHVDNPIRIDRPAPTPPVEVRPKKLPVTAIEKWMKDPYGIYAQYILNLRKLSPLEQKLDAAARGTLVHNVVERFQKTYPDSIPSDAMDGFLCITKEEIQKSSPDKALIALWMPRLSKIGDWMINHEIKWRENYTNSKQEVDGAYPLTIDGESFIVTARADRIDLSKDGTSAAIIDYKTGGQYSMSRMENGLLPQLPLEALILENGGFEGIKLVPVTALSYWVLNGSGKGGEEKILKDEQKLRRAVENAKEGLKELVHVFNRQETAYYSLPRPHNAPRYNDYEHLARVKEWSALDDHGDAQ